MDMTVSSVVCTKHTPYLMMHECTWQCRHLVVDAGTLSALNIFREERHPSNMGIGTSKEGFSVYGMLQRCVTPMVSH